MKIKVLPFAVFFVLITAVASAQHVSVRLDFPVGISTRPAGRVPYPGAIWIGPEWVWRGGRYISVPGYWAKPGRYGAIWVPGHWKYSRRGYRWIPGHWK